MRVVGHVFKCQMNSSPSLPNSGSEAAQYSVTLTACRQSGDRMNKGTLNDDERVGNLLAEILHVPWKIRHLRASINQLLHRPEEFDLSSVIDRYFHKNAPERSGLYETVSVLGISQVFPVLTA